MAARGKAKRDYRDQAGAPEGWPDEGTHGTPLHRGRELSLAFHRMRTA
jgi:hypothetical protein